MTIFPKARQGTRYAGRRKCAANSERSGEFFLGRIHFDPRYHNQGGAPAGLPAGEVKAVSIAIVVTSGKGGTGKTSLVGGVGSCLAALGERVLCIDMDVGLRNLDLNLGLTDLAVMDFTDVVSGRCSLARAAVEHPQIAGLFLLTAPLSLEPDITANRVRELVRAAKEGFDVVLLDCPAGLGAGFQLAAAAADRGIVVSTTDPSALRDAQRTVAALTPQVPLLHLVMNRVQPKLIRKLQTNLDKAMDAAGLPLMGVVPEDAKVALAAGAGKPLILTAHRGAAQAYLNIAKRLMGQRVPLMMM